jgi:zinc transport system permease protein
MEVILELFSYDFFRTALFAGIFISIACGIMGTLIVSNKLTFMAGGIAHSAYAGIGLAFFFGFNPTFSAMLVSVFFAIILGLVSMKNKHRTDAVIGVLWAVGMSIGIIFIDYTPGYTADLMSWLFGSIVAVSDLDLILSIILVFVIALIIFSMYKEFVALTYDEEFAKISGVPVKLLYFLLLILTALSVVIMIRIVGLIMLIAMLTIPALISEKFTSSLFKMMLLSSILGIVFITAGIFLSYFFNLTSGATIILVSALAYGLSFIFRIRKA